MSAVATTLTKFQIGAAASAIAVATAFTPVVAHANPAPLPQDLGSSLGNLLCDIVPGGGCVQGPFIGSSVLWIGNNDPTPPPFTTLLSFQPLTLLPTFIQPLFGWFNNINLEVCVAGLGLHVGGYNTGGTVSVTLGGGC